ncbi:hypothetical protein Dimus_012264 [Dionaea muscipula]
MGSASQIAISVEEMLSRLPLQSTNSCIYRVPENIRKTNEEAYRPMVVSIGPFHHGDPKLLPMQEQKLRYLEALRNKAENNNFTTDYVRIIKEHEALIREYYAENIISPAGDEFIVMVLLDSAFIIETFLRSTGFHTIDPNDRLFLRPKIINQVVRDLKLLENQLPFFILEKLYQHVNIKERKSFGDVTYKFFNLEPRVTPIENIKHFVDLLRTCYLPSTRRPQGLVEQGKIGFRVSITNLQEAGIRFKSIVSASLLDIEFDDGGVLKIPTLKLQDDTESFFRNLVVFEQCHHSSDSYIIDYVALLDFLINTPKDVELLVEKKILENWLGNSEDAANVFNNLFKQVTIASSNFYYSSLCDQLERYYNTRCHRYCAMLRRDYFGHPWAIISFIFAILLFILALIQAIAGVLSLGPSGGFSSSKH